MGQVRRFEDLLVWQRARLICLKVKDFAKKPDFSRDFELANQCRRSEGSIMDNIAEGFERDGNREFLQFLSIAKGSCGELRSQMYRVFDYQYILKEEFDNILKEVIEESIMLKSLMNSIKESEIKGLKYK